MTVTEELGTYRGTCERSGPEGNGRFTYFHDDTAALVLNTFLISSTPDPFLCLGDVTSSSSAIDINSQPCGMEN